MGKGVKFVGSKRKATKKKIGNFGKTVISIVVVVAVIFGWMAKRKLIFIEVLSAGGSISVQFRYHYHRERGLFHAACIEMVRLMRILTACPEPFLNK